MAYLRRKLSLAARVGSDRMLWVLDVMGLQRLSPFALFILFFSNMSLLSAVYLQRDKGQKHSEQVLMPTNIVTILRPTITYGVVHVPTLETIYTATTLDFVDDATSATSAMRVLQLTPADFINKDRDDILIRLQALMAFSKVMHVVPDLGTFLETCNQKAPPITVAPQLYSTPSIILYNDKLKRSMVRRRGWFMAEVDAEALLAACCEFISTYDISYDLDFAINVNIERQDRRFNRLARAIADQLAARTEARARPATP